MNIRYNTFANIYELESLGVVVKFDSIVEQGKILLLMKKPVNGGVRVATGSIKPKARELFIKSLERAEDGRLAVMTRLGLTA